MKTILLILFSNVLLAQVQNPNFELWDLYNGREKPTEWFCPNLCQSTECGPCDKIVQGDNDLAVRIHNVMPCVSSDNQAKSRSKGFIHHRFMPAGHHFRMSFDLIIDSVEAPAAFVMTIWGKGLPPSGIIWETDSLLSQRVERHILLDLDYDSVFILFESKGYLKQNAEHDCDLGYISAIIDNIETENIVSTKPSELKNIQISPNPFHNVLTIEGEFLAVFWRLFDLTGKMVMEGNSNRIDGLGSLQQGMYLIQIMDGSTIYFEKVVKN